MILLVCSYTVKMNTPVAVVFFTFICLSALHSQAQQTNITVYPAQVLDSAEEVCPPNEQREAVRRNISQDVQRIITRRLRNLSSCNQLDARATSDYYWITNSSGNAVYVYCDTNGERWDRSGGWFRIAYLNMTNQNQSCPSQWRYITTPRRTCGRVTSRGCDSVTYSSLGISYSQVCGRLVGYQFGSTEAFWYYNHRSGTTIDDPYVDGGVSITHGNPREHIWTLASGHSQNKVSTHDCRCNNGNQGVLVPPWVGDDYFCDSGNPNPTESGGFFSDDPLWDGAGCGSTTTCCEFNSPPWFCKQLDGPTTDGIEIRLCGDESARSNEDTPIELIEIYVQ